MAFDVSGISNYTKDNMDVLLSKLIFGSETIGLMTPQPGIKTTENIHLLETDATFQAPGCSFSSSGTTTITKRSITVGGISVQEALCPKDLEQKAFQLIMKAGTKYDELPEGAMRFAAAYVDRKLAHIHKNMEVAIWQGDTGSGSGNLNKFDGLLKIVDADGTVVNGNPGGVTVATGITSTNVLTVGEDFLGEVPSEVYQADDFMVFCSWEYLRLLNAKVRALNLYHYKPEGAKKGELLFPGEDIKFKAVSGLNGTNRLIGMRTGNMYFGTDLENEYEQFSLEYASEAKQVRFEANWKAGVNYAFGTEVVEFTLVP